MHDSNPTAIAGRGGLLFGSRLFLGYFLFIVLILGAGLPKAAQADVQDVVIADVTTRAFSVVWASDEAVTDATVRVYQDVGGVSEITSGLALELTSSAIPSAHSLGIVKVDVVGLDPSTTYYVQTDTTGAGGTVVYPDPGALLPVTTADSTTVANPDGTPITNDLLVQEVLDPDGVTPADGALLLLKVPAVSQYPLTAFVADGILTPGSIIDLNNLVDDANGTNVQVVGGTVIEISEYRGLLCSGLDSHILTRLRRAPDHEETPAITEAEPPAACFSPGGVAADFNCDGAVDPVDFNEFLIRFGLINDSASPNCQFNPDFDLAADNKIDPVDFNEFLIVFGTSE